MTDVTRALPLGKPRGRQPGDGPRAAVGVMARAPSSAGKTRLAPHLSAPRLAALRSALLADTLRTVAAVPDIVRVVFFTPHDGEPEIAALAERPLAAVPQAGDDLGERMRSAFHHLLADREHAVLVGTDMPLLRADHFAEAFAALERFSRLTVGGSCPRTAHSGARRQARVTGDGSAPERAPVRGHPRGQSILKRAPSSGGGVVLGPADDGGYYLIGMNAVHGGLFERVAWGTERVLGDTLLAAERLGIEASLIRSGYDIDTIEDLRRLERDLSGAPPEIAPHVRGWFTEGW